MSIPRNEPKVIRSRQIKHYDKNSFLAELRDIMRYMINDNNPEVLWEDFKTKLFSLLTFMHLKLRERLRANILPG